MRVGSINASQIHAAVGEGWEKVAKERLGPAIRDDARSVIALWIRVRCGNPSPTPTTRPPDVVRDGHRRGGRAHLCRLRRAGTSGVSPVNGSGRAPPGSPRNLFFGQRSYTAKSPLRPSTAVTISSSLESAMPWSRHA